MKSWALPGKDVRSGSRILPIVEQTHAPLWPRLRPRLLREFADSLGATMKNMFSLVSFVVGILSFVIGFGNLLFLTQSLSSTLAGLAAIGLGGACLWLAMETVASS